MENVENFKTMNNKKELINKTYKGSLVLVINLCTFGLFFLRDILASRFFGISTNLDSVYLAIMVPSLIANFLYQPLSDLLIPKYQARLTNQSNIMHLYLNVIFYVAFSSLVISIIVFNMSGVLASILASGFSSDKQVLVASFIQKSTPIILIGGLIISTNIFLNTISMYVVSSAAAIVVPLVAIGYVYLFGAAKGEETFIVGMILGQIVNLLVVLYCLIKNSHGRYSYRGFKIQYLKKSAVFEYGSQNLANLCFYGLNTISASMGTHFQEGTTTLVILVNKLIGFFTNLFNATYTSVLMPYMSRVYLDSKARFNSETRMFLMVITSISFIGIIVVVSMSNIFSEVLFFSSKITADQKKDFVKYLELGIFQVPFLVSLIFLFKLLTINSKFKLLSILATLTIVGDVAAIYLLKGIYGVSSVLIAPYLVVLTIVALLLFYFKKYNHGISNKDYLILFSLWISLTIFMFLKVV